MKREAKVGETFGDPRLGMDHLWRDLRVGCFPQPIPALFLDRDGVIIEEKEYIRDPAEVKLIPGITELIRAARKLGMAIVEITNQAGIARGYSGWPEFIAVENRLARLLAEKDAELDAVFACPFHERGLPPYDVPNHAWRKPNPGMLLEAARLLNLALPKSLLVGDKASDQLAARAAQLACGIHVLTGYGRAQKELCSSVATDLFPVWVMERPDQAGPLLKRAIAGVQAWPSGKAEAGTYHNP